MITIEMTQCKERFGKSARNGVLHHSHPKVVSCLSDMRKDLFMVLQGQWEMPPVETPTPRLHHRILKSKEENEDLEESLRPVLWLSRFFGICLLERNGSVFWWSLSYGLICLGLFIGGVLYIHNLDAKKPQNFDTKVSLILNIILNTIGIIGPMITWWESKKFIKYLQEWKNLQVHWRYRTGTSLRIQLLARSAMLVLWGTVLSAALEVFYEYDDRRWNFEWIVVVTYTWQDCARLVVLLRWHITLRALAQAAHTFLAVAPSMRPKHQKEIWLQLSYLLREFGQKQGNTYCFFAIYLFLTTTMCLFGWLRAFMKDWKELSGFFYLFVEGIFSIIMLYTFCNDAYYASNILGDEYKKNLFLMQTTFKDEEYEDLIATIQAFPPEINLLGFAVINRQFFYNVVTLIASYLVVLAQFRLSSGEI